MKKNSIKLMTLGLALTLGSGFVVKNNYSKKTYNVKADNSYDLWVAGIQVTDENKNDILGDGKISFDNLSNALSINGTNILSQETGVSHTEINDGDLIDVSTCGIASTLETLTITFDGVNKIGSDYNGDIQTAELSDFDFQYGIVSTGDINLIGEGTLTITDAMQGISADNIDIKLDSENGTLTVYDFGLSQPLPPCGIASKYDVTIDGGFVDVKSYGSNGINSDFGDILIKNAQVDIDANKYAVLTGDGDITIENSFLQVEYGMVGIEAGTYEENLENGNLLIKNSLVYETASEGSFAAYYATNTLTFDGSRIYVNGESDDTFTICCGSEMIVKGNSFIYFEFYSEYTYYAFGSDAESKIVIEDGFIYTNLYSPFNAYNTAEPSVVIGSESNPLEATNLAVCNESYEPVPVTSFTGDITFYDTELEAYFGQVVIEDIDANDGFASVGTYATVSMADYEFGSTPSTPSSDRVAFEWNGAPIEWVTYYYYPIDGEFDEDLVWEDIESDTLEEGTYYMVAQFIDVTGFSYLTEPVEFEVTSSSKTEIDIPEQDESEFTYTGDEQTYNVAENDAYTIDGNRQTNAGTYTVTISLNDTSTTCWSDGKTDDLEYEFVINKAEQNIVISELGQIYDKTEFSVIEKDSYRTKNYFTKLGDGVTTVEYKLKSEDDSKYTTTRPINAGDYTVKVSVAEGTNYLAGCETKDFTIERASIAKVGFGDITQPVANGTAPTNVGGIAIGSRYSGTIEWSPALVDGKFDYETTYTATVTLDIVPSSSDNYQFGDDYILVRPTSDGWEKSDDSTSTKLIYTKTFAPTEKVINITNDISKTYDGSPVSEPTYENAGDGEVTIQYKLAGAEDTTYTSTAPTNAGSYVVKVISAETTNYPGSFDTAEFTIARAKVAIPEGDSSTFIFSGREQTFEIQTNDLYTISGNKQTNAGTHTVTVTLNDKVNYSWEDDTTDDLTFTFVIGKAMVAKPEVESKSFAYDGNEQILEIPENDLYTVTGNKQTNAGTHTVTVVLKDKTNTCWSDGTINDLTFTFEIVKADTCNIHYFLIAILAISAIGFGVLFFAFKKPMIVLGLALLLLCPSIILTVVGHCSLCLIFGIIDISLCGISLIASCFLMIRMLVKKEGK